jgi:hypothetical protein
MGVAGEHFIAQGNTIKCHDKCNAHLLAVGTMVARITALGLRVAFGLPSRLNTSHAIPPLHGDREPARSGLDVV